MPRAIQPRRALFRRTAQRTLARRLYEISISTVLSLAFHNGPDRERGGLECKDRPEACSESSNEPYNTLPNT